MLNAGNRGAKSVRILGLAGHAYRKETTPVEAVTSGNDLMFWSPASVYATSTRELKRGLIGLST